MNIKSLKISNLNRVLKKNGLFNILTFLDHKDIFNLLSIRNKQFRLLINKSISDAYYLKIKEYFAKFKEYLEVLKYSLIYSKIKDLLKIDIIINIRFRDLNNVISQLNPKFFQIIYLYEYLINNQNDKNKLYDFYQFDLFNKNYINSNEKNKAFKGIYLSKEISLLGIDKNYDVINYQPILPFKINDKGIFYFEIYSPNNYFIDASKIKIKLKSIDLNKHIKYLEDNNINNIRISEYEMICQHWNKEPKINGYIQILKKFFESHFIINDILCDDYVFCVYKFHLTAKITGFLFNNDLNIKIYIKGKNDYIENEIKKNNLLFEKSKIIEIRVGESIIFYIIFKQA